MAFDGLVISNLNVSFSSSIVSVVIGIETDLDVSPGAKVKLPVVGE